MTVIVRYHASGYLETIQDEPGISRKRWWTITGSYVTPQGKQEFSVKSPKKCRLPDMQRSVARSLREDAALTGGIDAIEWTATGR